MKTYKKLVIYYFTGTGNSLKVAEWISGIGVERNVNTTLLNITEIGNLHTKAPDPEALIVFISPIHGFNYPPVMLKFIKYFPKGKNDVALMNTRGGMLIGKFITPGLTGVAFFLSSFLLKIKGYSIKAMYPVDMPSNWISLHPGLNQHTIKFLHCKNKERVRTFAKRIISGKSSFKALSEIIQDSITSLISITYFLVGRFMFSKTYYSSKDCNNCGICIIKCPVNAIKMIDSRPFWTFKCESCMRCMSNCPRKAIETAHGSIIGILFLFNGLLLGVFNKYFELLFFKIEGFVSQFLFETILFLSMLGMWYRIIHYLMRYRFFERVIVYTSLTKYKFWGRRYQALNDNEFVIQINKED